MSRLLIAGLCALALTGGAFAQTGWGTPAPQAAKPAATAAAAAAPTLKDIEVLQKAVADAWEKMPMTPRRAMFVTEKADLFGHFVPRPSAEFKAGDKLFAYIEPAGYVWKANGDAYDFGVVVDFVVKSPDGKILAGQDGFGKFSMTSRAKVQEFMLNLSLSMDGATPGQYILQYKLHDLYSDKLCSVELPFTITP